jgi:hypothetical protein
MSTYVKHDPRWIACHSDLTKDGGATPRTRDYLFTQESRRLWKWTANRQLNTFFFMKCLIYAAPTVTALQFLHHTPIFLKPTRVSTANLTCVSTVKLPCVSFRKKCVQRAQSIQKYIKLNVCLFVYFVCKSTVLLRSWWNFIHLT